MQIYIDDADNSLTVPFETIYIQETVTKQYELRIPHGKEAVIRVIRDKTVIIDETIPYPRGVRIGVLLCMKAKSLKP